MHLKTMNMNRMNIINTDEYNKLLTENISKDYKKTNKFRENKK